MIDVIGWCATAVFVASYFATPVRNLRRLQMLGAIIWLIYGVAIWAPPVVVANGLVFASAAWTAWKRH